MRVFIRGAVRSHIIYIFALMLTVFAMCAVFVDSVTLLKYLNGVSIAIALGVSILYAPIAWRALRNGLRGSAGILGFGIFIGWLAFAGFRAISVLNLNLDWIDLRSTKVVSAFVLLSVLAAFAHYAAPEAIDGRLSLVTWGEVGAIVAIGLVLAFFLIQGFVLI